MATAIPGGSSDGSPTRREALLHSEKLPKRAVVERVIDALRDVPGLMRRQKDDPLDGKVREALGGEVETRRGERMGEERGVSSMIRA